MNFVRLLFDPTDIDGATTYLCRVGLGRFGTYEFHFVRTWLVGVTICGALLEMMNETCTHFCDPEIRIECIYRTLCSHVWVCTRSSQSIPLDA